MSDIHLLDDQEHDIFYSDQMVLLWVVYIAAGKHQEVFVMWQYQEEL